MPWVDSCPAILAIGTAVPPHQITQADVYTWVSESLQASPAQRRWLNRLYTLSGIETRHSCLPDAQKLMPHSRFAPGRPIAETPTTAERMTIYQHEAVQVGVLAAERALTAAPISNAAEQVTHLIVVSCTGFFAPGLDLAIARRIGLRPSVQRTLVGFMGCAAAFNGLRLATQIIAGQPEAHVLLVCVELCTLHLQPTADRVALTVASLFADGAAACLIGAAGKGGDLLLLNRLHSQVQPDTDDAMAWRIGDHGFVMQLSPDVPRYAGTLATSALTTLLDGQRTPTFWAIHPGGRAIVDRLAELLELTPAQTAASYSILRRYGNMSSPTILFVLRELLDQLRTSANSVDGVAAAFGPGLVTEMAYLTYVPPVTQRPSTAHLPQLLEVPQYVA
ncbi:MAG: type III polyketide synthase [Oscillochloris sp.]|nr:type III polyketide synthase [Oscillochloris sp.]